MSTFILVHGAWHGAWCWEKLVPLLERSGHRVVAPDLPGHGDDPTPLCEITLERYREKICKVVATQAEPVILVGHSMGGIAITEAAEHCSSSIKALVYLCAFLPANGESLLHWAEQSPESLVTQNMVVAEDGVSATLRDDSIVDAFYHDCADDTVAWAKAYLHPQALAPIATPVSVSAEHFGRLHRYYVECLKDRAIPPALQRAMHNASPCQSVFSLNTGHSPFLADPEALAATLSAIERMTAEGDAGRTTTGCSHQ